MCCLVSETMCAQETGAEHSRANLVGQMPLCSCDRCPDGPSNRNHRWSSGPNRQELTTNDEWLTAESPAGLQMRVIPDPARSSSIGRVLLSIVTFLAHGRDHARGRLVRRRDLDSARPVRRADRRACRLHDADHLAPAAFPRLMAPFGHAPLRR
jgi:hypothetical protein